jgi:hypothetical protein
MLTKAPVAIEGAGGDHQTFKVACAVKDHGVSELTALHLMAEHWNPRCIPPWNDEALAVKVANAYRYGKRAVGEGSPQADFEAVEQASTEIPTEGPKQRSKLYWRRYSEIEPRLGETSLVQKLLGEGAMSVVYGQSNTGKTFFAMALAHAIATGQPFAGLKVTQGAVVYVAAEAGVSAENRVAALRQACEARDVPFALVPCPVDLLRGDGDTAPLIELIRAVEAELGKVRLVVIDTLSRAIAGGNENDSADMGALVKHLDAVRNASRAHVMVVHHAGKDQAKGARGHSLLRAATDTEIEIADGVATTTKQRDMEASPPIGFDLKVVELGTGPDGMTVTSCVCVPMQAGSAAEDFADDNPRMGHLLDALDAAVAANGGQPVSGEAWIKAAENAVSDGINSGNKGFLEAWKGCPRTDSRGRQLRTLRTRADEKGLVRKNKRGQWVRA